MHCSIRGNNTKGNSLTVIDPSTAKVVGEVPVLDPCNLYCAGHNGISVED